MTEEKRLVIYEQYEGITEPTDKIIEIGRLVSYCGNNTTEAIKAVFYATESENPAILCEITKNSNLVMGWPNETLSLEVQSILLHGIVCSRDILPSHENKEFVFYRHGNDVFTWLRGLA